MTPKLTGIISSFPFYNCIYKALSCGGCVFYQGISLLNQGCPCPNDDSSFAPLQFLYFNEKNLSTQMGTVSSVRESCPVILGKKIRCYHSCTWHLSRAKWGVWVGRTAIWPGPHIKGCLSFAYFNYVGIILLFSLVSCFVVSFLIFIMAQDLQSDSALGLCGLMRGPVHSDWWQKPNRDTRLSMQL